MADIVTMDLDELLKADLLKVAEELQAECAKLQAELDAAPEAAEAPDVYVMYTDWGPIPGGAVRATRTHKNPPAEALLVPHKHISKEVYESAPALQVTW